jgi:hypothetical protein
LAGGQPFASSAARAQLFPHTVLFDLDKLFLSWPDFGLIGSMTGAHGDSYYEYLLKQWIMTGKTDDVMLQRYKRAMHGVRKR